MDATATDTVLAPELEITKTGSGTVNSTDQVSFTITVTNDVAAVTAGTAYDVNVSDALPDSAHLTWTTTTPGATINGGTLTDDIGDMTAGDSVTIVVSATTAPGYSAILNNTATATATNNDPGSVEASATDTVLAPDLTITKTGSGTVNFDGRGVVHDHGEQHGRGRGL